MPSGSPSEHDRQLTAWSAELDRIEARPRHEPVVCEGCRHFEQDPINPDAGMGACRLGVGMWHPGARHWCGKVDGQ